LGSEDPPETNVDRLTLNPPQQEAVDLPVGPALVLAGPGTGKTRVLTERVRHLVTSCGIPPDTILALTFTNKAAAEMAARLRVALAGSISMPHIGTFHRFCIGVLREHGEAAGRTRTFTIADEDLQRTVLYRTRQGLHIDDAGLGNLLSNLSRFRRDLRVSRDEHLAPSLRDILRAYEAELLANNLVDFDDLIFLVHDLFRDREDILSVYRERHRHLLVDEFQDTDREQYGIVRLLSEQHRSLFVVADDEQSIYAWRNADPENITRLQRDFPETGRPIVLTQNYRSSEEILNLARRLINRNEVRYEREVVSRRRGSAVRGLAFDSDASEGRFIAREIGERLKASPEMDPASVAVLYPRHAIGIELERTFMRAGLPCQVSQRRGIFDQPVLRRTLSVLRYALDGDDDASLENFLRRELDAVDPALYPAIRAHQAQSGARAFKQAAFHYLRDAASGEALEVERALGLAGVAANAVKKLTTSFSDLVDDILDQVNTSSLPSIKNHLTEIRDPLTIGGIAEAAEALRPFCRPGATIYVACPDQALRHVLIMLFTEALRSLGPVFRGADPGDPLDMADAAVVAFTDDRPASTGPFVHLGKVVRDMGTGPAIVAFKLCQALVARESGGYLSDYTAFDIETTDLDVTIAEIVEIGAVRVRDGEEVDAFHVMVRPGGPITPGAFQTHGISRADVENAPSFKEAYPEFLAFAGEDVLVAHNGYGFDFQVLNAEVRRNGFPRPSNPTLDTLPMARAYVPEVGHSIDALCDRYGIVKEAERHRALHDAQYLHQAFEGLKRERDSRYRRMAHERLLDLVALAMLFQEEIPASEDQASEEAVHFKLGAQRLLGPSNSRIRDLVQEHPRLDEGRLKELALAWLNEEPRPESLAEHAPEQIQVFRALVNRHERSTLDLREAIRGFLDFADLYRPEDDAPPRRAVNLLTLHAAKGLEFEEVYICGLEEKSLPNARAVNSRDRTELEEQRRLLYVGMTRAMNRLTLTCARQRRRREAVPSRFWEELGIELEEPPS
jgi:DNA helicase II / ATP-dependent DNA helicase PcrA